MSFCFFRQDVKALKKKSLSANHEQERVAGGEVGGAWWRPGGISTARRPSVSRHEEAVRQADSEWVRAPSARRPRNFWQTYQPLRLSSCFRPPSPAVQQHQCSGGRDKLTQANKRRRRRENVSAAAADGERGVVPGQGAHSGHHEPQCEAGGVRRPRSHRAAGRADREGAPRGR